MFKDGTLYSSYNFQIKYPAQGTNIVDFILGNVSRHCEQGLGGNKWITNTETGEFCTISQAEPMSRRIASGLYKRGLRPGDVVLYSSHEPSRLHMFFMGVWRANGTLRACYPEESIDVMTERIKESKVKWFLCDPQSASEVTAAAKNVPWKVEVFVFGEAVACTSVEELFNDNGDACPSLEVHGDDTALILATSGTTGASKGAIHTHYGLVKTLATYTQCIYKDEKEKPMMEPESIDLIMGRPTHITGSCFPLSALVGGKHILMMRNITKENIFHAVHHYKPTTVFGFPKYLLYLVNDEDAKNYDLSSVQNVLVGGVVITPSYIKTMESLPGVRVINGYGMTECGFFSSTRNFDPNVEHSARVWPNVPDFSVGKITPGTMLQVRDVETGIPLGPNEQGELCFKSQIICAGYLNRPEENEKSFPGGWLRTGDVGYFDNDGFLYVVDRCKEIFKYYNNHISPSEVENIIHRHEAVDNVCVVGIADPEGGDTIPRAFVTLKDPRALADDIRKYSNDNLPPYKRLRGGLIILPELPVGKTGKVDRRLLSKIQISVPKEIGS